MIFACSGGSNVGQIANDAAKALTQLGQGRMSCVIGLAAHIAEFDERVEEAETVAVIDGCEQLCAAKAVEHLGHRPDVSVVVTDFGIAKEHNFAVSQEQVALVAGEVSRRLRRDPTTAARR
jgi:uncharacterized metal-binding protein